MEEFVQNRGVEKEVLSDSNVSMGYQQVSPPNNFGNLEVTNEGVREKIPGKLEKQTSEGVPVKGFVLVGSVLGTLLYMVNVSETGQYDPRFIKNLLNLAKEVSIYSAGGAITGILANGKDIWRNRKNILKKGREISLTAYHLPGAIYNHYSNKNGRNGHEK